MEPTLRLTQILKQEAEDISLQGNDIAEFVTRQQTLDREERAAWRDAQKFHAEEKKRADEIRMAEIQEEAEEKKRADELQAEEKRRADKIQLAQIEIEKELKIKEMELQTQAQATTSSASTPAPRKKDAKSPKLPSFIDENDKLNSYLLCFECYAENANWEKDTWAIKLSALLTETEETPDQFVICLKNYLAKWLELSGSSSGNFEALVDLIVKEQLINACSEELAVYLLERGPKDLVELTAWAQQYLITHKQ